ncbi:Peptidase S54, rhomboid domain [Dillenia turbinata]|uniref:Peptidase S54, rhomboid domain n=1 Tax=Dillenia turbinata TaxID=194707 RepID=A0AAN8VCB0_9MAGN
MAQLHRLFTLLRSKPLASIPVATASPHSKCILFSRLPSFPKAPVQIPPLHHHLNTLQSRLICRMNGSDIISQLELGKPEEKWKPEKRVNGIFWILLINIGIFVADHIFLVRGIKALYLYHNWPAWYQFVTAAFCHANWNHLSSNMFFLYIFGKLVEEEEGNFALWMSYILTGAGANLVSWLLLPRNAVSVGASGAVFGLFAISVLVKMSWDWRKILEVLILGQFVIEKVRSVSCELVSESQHNERGKNCTNHLVMAAAQASTAMSSSIRGGHVLQNINHIAHLSGALVGVALIWVLSRVPSEPLDTKPSRKKSDGTL